MGIMMLFWIVLIAIAIWVIFQLVGRGRWPTGGMGQGRAEDILKERYARGEIDRETYQRMLEDLRRSSSA